MTSDNTEQTEKEKQSRRPRLNFSEMGVPMGAELVYKGKGQHEGKEYTAIVLSDTTVLFEGKEEYLTNVISKITNKEHNHNPTHNWYYQGKHLRDIYCETYGEKLDFKTALARFKSEMNQKYLLTKKGKQFLIDVNNDKIEAIPTSTKKPIPVTDEQILGYLQDKDMSKQHLSYAPAIAAYIKTHYLTRNTQGDPQMSNTLASKVATLLTKTHNLILHGAPGTGKTHLARKIAEALGCSESEIGFVQFHPSYDYTDFVEGLRPVNNGDGQVGFERKDGVFKKFCERALKNFYDSKKSASEIEKEISIDEKISSFVSYAIENNTEFEIVTGNKFFITDMTDKSIVISIPANEKTNELSLPRNELKTLLSAEKSIENGNDIRTFFNRKWRTQQDSYNLVLYKKIETMKTPDKNSEISRMELKNFVFIIDEINRGDMSKIFGELFFAIEPGYRGAEKCNSLRTQYANLQSEPNAFDEVLKITDSDNFGHFFIPENLYIIGTMNDIDRGVESMDFAFRRRFTFVEVKASDTQETILSSLDAETRKKAIARMEALNNAITEIEGLSSAYHIGGAYFLKLKELDGDFDKLWEYHLAPLLREYLRGMENEDEKFNDLKKAYTLGE